MKGWLSTLFFIVSICSLKAQDFSIGKYDKLHSNILNEDREMLVHIPKSNGDNVRFPVMYLLDGENHFTKTVGIVDHLSNTAGNELCPKMIIVSIIHRNREKDLIPPASNNDTSAKDLFPEFLERELIPFIDSKYPTEPYRVFTGHSLGGLRVINTLVYQPQLFNSYIALDPSLGMVNNWIGNATDEFAKKNYDGKSLYIAMGLTMPKEMDTAAIIRDTSGNSRHMRCIITFAKKAELITTHGLDFNWKYYPDETHQSIVFKGTYDGLTSNFHWFKNEKLFDIFKPEISAESSVKIINDYYSFISVKMGYKMLPPEQGTSELTDYLIFKKWYDKALAFAELNHRNYPLSIQTKKQLESVKWLSRKSISDLMSQKKVDKITSLIRQESKKKEPEYNISEEAINSLGYELMKMNRLSEAETIFELNAELYPDSYNVYDSLGECLLAAGKTSEGLNAYRKSLELNSGNTNAINILSKYQSEKR